MSEIKPTPIAGKRTKTGGIVYSDATYRRDYKVTMGLTLLAIVLGLVIAAVIVGVCNSIAGLL